MTFIWQSFRRPSVLVSVLICALLAPRIAAAQDQPATDEPLKPADVVRLFDAYEVVQAQDALGLDETQYGRFVPRLKALLEARRRFQVARGRLLAQLGKLTRPDLTTVDENAIRDTLRTLTEESAKSQDEVRKALDGVDEVLTVRQRGRFRVFEEQMERKKLELLMRARQSARPANRRPPS